MFALSVILYFVCFCIYFMVGSAKKKFLTIAMLAISIVFAIINVNSILAVVVYLSMGVLCLILFGAILSNIKFDILTSNKKDINKIEFHDVTVMGIKEDSTNIAEVIGSIDDFVVTIYVKNQKYDFRVVDGDIAEYRSNNMKNFVRYGGQNNEE